MYKMAKWNIINLLPRNKRWICFRLSTWIIFHDQMFRVISHKSDIGRINIEQWKCGGLVSYGPRHCLHQAVCFQEQSDKNCFTYLRQNTKKIHFSFVMTYLYYMKRSKKHGLYLIVIINWGKLFPQQFA